ncbi:hypothetical protein ACSIGC_08310 [Tenacibaculum sp. ZS6-P6]|uniref:hypothetical protein n=1 Tax=Tenacibaculum sp. ZS6-P6 TaxID=3447503 RepID=UPI003F986091
MSTKEMRISTLFKALKTKLPIDSPIGSVTPSALNFNQASMKLIADIKPIQRNINAMYNLLCFIKYKKIFLSVMYLNFLSF